MPDPHRVSHLCWDGKHSRCTGWIVTSGRHEGGHSQACACKVCQHPYVPPDRHLHEPVQKGKRWSSSTTTL